MEKEKIIEVENLVKKFGNFIANDHLSFQVAKGEIFGFLGANGAGKTTAIKILCGLSLPTSGSIIMVDGKIAALDTPPALKEKFDAPDINDVFLKLARKTRKIE